MRIVCDSCATRYAIDDARLPDRPFKVRCKRCQKNIVVRRKSRPRWHLAPAGQEVGPLTTAEIQEGLATGAIDEGTHAWREGMQSWETLDQVHELRPVRESGRPGLFDHLSAPDEPLVAAGERNSALPATGGVPLVASRNEASVLFSIANLRDLRLLEPE